MTRADVGHFGADSKRWTNHAAEAVRAAGDDPP